MKALIHVTLKPDVLDPQGKAIRNACASLGYVGIEEVRQGKLFEIRLIDADYYRTSFGSGTNQSNYWISTGIVLRLFRGWSD